MSVKRKAVTRRIHLARPPVIVGQHLEVNGQAWVATKVTVVTPTEKDAREWGVLLEDGDQIEVIELEWPHG